MNILLINHYAGSPRHGMAFRPYYLAREWMRMGHNVRILAGSYSHIRAIQPAAMAGAFVNENIDGIEYCWYRTPTYIGNGFGRVKSILSFIWSLWRDAKLIAKDFKPNVVIASSTYPMDIWPAQRIAKLANAKLVFEVHDLWPLSPIEIGGMSRWHPFIVWVQWAEDHAYKHADHIVSMLPKTLDYMVSRGMKPEKWSYVPNGVDLDEWRVDSPLSADTDAVLQAVKSRGLPVLGYAGTHGLANALDVLLDASKLLKGLVEIVLVGSGPEKDRLIRRVSTENLSNVTMLNPVPKTTIPALLRSFDMAFIGWHHNTLYRFGISPNKLMDYMMAAKPIIHAVEAGNDPVAEVGCGITVRPNNATEIAKAALALAALSPEEMSAMGIRGEVFIKAERNYVVLAQQFLNAIDFHFPPK